MAFDFQVVSCKGPTRLFEECCYYFRRYENGRCEFVSANGQFEKALRGLKSNFGAAVDDSIVEFGLSCPLLKSRWVLLLLTLTQSKITFAP